MYSYHINMGKTDILLRFYKNMTNLMESIQLHDYSQKELLGEEYSGIERLTKDDKKILLELCAKGVASHKEESESLMDFGTIYFD